MDVREFDSASRSDKEAGPSSSRVTEEELDSGRCSVAETADSASRSVTKALDSVSSILRAGSVPILRLHVNIHRIAC